MLDRVPDTYDKRDTAPIPTALGPAAFVMEGFYLSLDQVQRQAFVQTASGPVSYTHLPWMDSCSSTAGCSPRSKTAGTRSRSPAMTGCGI